MRRSPCLLAAALLLAVCAFGLLLSACGQAAAQQTPIPGEPPPSPTPEQPVGPATPPALTPASPSVLTLTVWTTEAFSPTQAITTGQILAEKAAGVEAAQTGVRFRFVPKKPYGKGGILDYLLTTGAVVPTLLPDLAFIDVDELGAAVQSGLVQPLDALLPPEVVADLYPFARDACTLDGKLYCLQFEANLDHAVYNPNKMSHPPGSWTEVLSRPGPYLFPAGGQAGLVNDAFLTQYLAVWPAGAPDAQQPFLDEQSLVAVLQFYRDGASRGIFPTLVLDYHSTDDTWQAYLSGQGAMAQVSAQRYLADRARAATSLLSSIPAINGPGAAITQGWALALITPDPLRQEAVRPFLVEWLAPETNAAWNRAAGTLPTRQAALALWDQSDPYTAFLHEQLLGARPRPRLANYNQVAAALQQAVEAVLTGALTPEEAAAQVMSIDR